MLYTKSNAHLKTHWRSICGVCCEKEGHHVIRLLFAYVIVRKRLVIGRRFYKKEKLNKWVHCRKYEKAFDLCFCCYTPD